MVGIEDGLFNGKLAASTSNHVLGRTGVYHELEAIPEGAPLANQGLNVNIAGWQREFEADDLSNRNFHAEHRRNA